MSRQSLKDGCCRECCSRDGGNVSKGSVADGFEAGRSSKGKRDHGDTQVYCHADKKSNIRKVRWSPRVNGFPDGKQDFEFD